MRLERARMAKAANLDPDNYAMPYPSNQHISIQHSNGGLWKGALLGAALLAGGGLGTMGVASALGWLTTLKSTPEVPPAQPLPATGAAAQLPRASRFKVTFRALDGTPLEIKPLDPADE